jgi:hypothetical protein
MLPALVSSGCEGIPIVIETMNFGMSSRGVHFTTKRSPKTPRIEWPLLEWIIIHLVFFVCKRIRFSFVPAVIESMTDFPLSVSWRGGRG